ncbi:hypothetical protein ScPMuIL_004226, partial [Solemya velum]
DPFYIAPRTTPISNLADRWFIKQKVGEKKLSNLMKAMCEQAGFHKRLTNHSARKTLIQKLRSENVPPTDIIQITGHKQIQSILNYSNITEEQHKTYSNILNDANSISTSRKLKPTHRRQYHRPIPNPNGKATSSISPSPSHKATGPEVKSMSPSSKRMKIQPTTSTSQNSHSVDQANVNLSAAQTFNDLNQELNSIFYGATIHVGNMNIY